jgi:hypothetical protein
VCSAHLLLGLTFATIAIPLKLSLQWTGMLWFAEVAILAILGTRVRLGVYRAFAAVLAVFALLRFFAFDLWGGHRYLVQGWSVSWSWTLGVMGLLCYSAAAAASRRFPREHHRVEWEGGAFHLYAALAAVLLWSLTMTTSSLARWPLYGSLEALGVTLLGWAIRDRGIRLIGAIWFVAPVGVVVAARSAFSTVGNRPRRSSRSSATPPPFASRRRRWYSRASCGG